MTDDQGKVPAGAHPGETSWTDGSVSNADTSTGDLTTETGEQLYRETDQHGEPLEKDREKA